MSHRHTLSPIQHLRFLLYAKYVAYFSGNYFPVLDQAQNSALFHFILAVLKKYEVVQMYKCFQRTILWIPVYVSVKWLCDKLPHTSKFKTAPVHWLTVL